MKIVSAAEMREIDRITSERFGVPSLTLMENAGTAVADFVISHYPAANRISVICGKGNNGGDGFVAARKLQDRGREVKLVLLAEPSELRGDAAEMFRKLSFSPILARSENDLKAHLDADVLVDAILGTGFRPPVSGLYAVAIAAVNAKNRSSCCRRHSFGRRRRCDGRAGGSSLSRGWHRYFHGTASSAYIRKVD